MNHIRRTKLKSSDAMDHWLDTQGLYRKHTARDGSCLFRAVAEQLFYTQSFHLKVRKECVNFMQKNSSHYQDLVEGPFEEYIERMRNQFQWGGKVELEAMANRYKCEVVVHHQVGVEPLKAVTNWDSNKKLSLCFSHGNHYDSVYTKDHIANAAFCQSMVYTLVYEEVFGVTEVDYAVAEMLHNKTFKDQRRREVISQVTPPDDIAAVASMRTWIQRGITPFPYKVAKALDPDLYRNIEFDVWSDMRRELRLGLLPASGELHAGLKCLVKLAPDDAVSYSAYVQSVAPGKGAVEVFIAELGGRRTVPYQQVQPLANEPANHASPQATELGNKWQKLRLNRARKFKDSFSPMSGCYENEGRSLPSVFEQSALPSDSTPHNHQPMDTSVGSSPLAMFNTSTPQPGAGPHLVTFMPTSAVSSLGYYSASPSPPAGTSLGYYTASPSPPIGSSLGYYTASPSPPTGTSLGYYTASPSPPTGSGLGYYTASPSPPVGTSVGFYTPSPPPPAADGEASVQIKDVEGNVINTTAPRSVLLDGSDLALVDKPTVRFFYNLGLDYFPLLHMSPTGSDSQLTDGNVADRPTAAADGLVSVPTCGSSEAGAQLVNVYVECSCTEGEPISNEAEMDPCYAVARVGYPWMYGYYQQPVPYYEYTVNNRPMESSAVDHHQVSPPCNDSSQHSLDTSGVYPYGLQLNRLPTSFLFHGGSSNGMYAPPTLNGVPYSPPPNGAFALPPPPGGVFSVPPPVTPVNSHAPWFVSQASTQSK